MSSPATVAASPPSPPPWPASCRSRVFVLSRVFVAVALKPQIGHNIGFQAPINPRSAWARSRTWYAAHAGWGGAEKCAKACQKRFAVRSVSGPRRPWSATAGSRPGLRRRPERVNKFANRRWLLSHDVHQKHGPAHAERTEGRRSTDEMASRARDWWLIGVVDWWNCAGRMGGIFEWTASLHLEEKQRLEMARFGRLVDCQVPLRAHTRGEQVVRMRVSAWVWSS